MSYEVEHHEHGILVRGSIPVGDFAFLEKAWRKQGWTLLHPGIAQQNGATLAITNPKHVDAWLSSARSKAAEDSGGDAELEWLFGPDTGTSSLTIFSVLSAKNKTAGLARMGRFGPDHPYDPDDFGRCYRLLRSMPSWRERLSEVVAVYPEWGPLVREWAQVEALFVEEEPSGRAPRCYTLMEQLIAEGHAAVGK